MYACVLTLGVRDERARDVVPEPGHPRGPPYCYPRLLQQDSIYCTLEHLIRRHVQEHTAETAGRLADLTLYTSNYGFRPGDRTGHVMSGRRELGV